MRRDPWPPRLDALPPNWTWRPPVVVSDEAAGGDARQQAFVLGGGARQRGRSADPTEAGYYDLPFYRRALRRLLADLGDDPVIADLGCGDGRGVRLLWEAGVRRVAALDFNGADLLDLWRQADAARRRELLLIHGSVLGPPLAEGLADGVLMTEVAYCLDEPEAGYRAAARWLRPGGLALVSNVAIHAYTVHALIERRWDQIEAILATGRYDQVLGEQLVQVTLFDEARMDACAGAAGMRCLQRFIVPGGAGLMLHALRAAGRDPAPCSSQLQRLVDRGLPAAPRLYIDVLRKEG